MHTPKNLFFLCFYQRFLPESYKALFEAARLQPKQLALVTSNSYTHVYHPIHL